MEAGPLERRTETGRISDPPRHRPHRRAAHDTGAYDRRPFEDRHAGEAATREPARRTASPTILGAAPGTSAIGLDAHCNRSGPERPNAKDQRPAGRRVRWIAPLGDRRPATAQPKKASRPVLRNWWKSTPATSPRTRKAHPSGDIFLAGNSGPSTISQTPTAMTTGPRMDNLAGNEPSVAAPTARSTRPPRGPGRWR